MPISHSMIVHNYQYLYRKPSSSETSHKLDEELSKHNSNANAFSNKAFAIAKNSHSKMIHTAFPSRDSETSMISSSSTSSLSTTDSDPESSSQGDPRRKIFSRYWHKTRDRSPEQPRSPRIQHYPSRVLVSAKKSKVPSGSKEESGSVVSPISIVPQQGQLLLPPKFVLPPAPSATSSPSRRSVLGEAGRGSGCISIGEETDESGGGLETFFSKRAHMIVLSSSLEDDSPLSSRSEWIQRKQQQHQKRRPRSYSCSDASFATTAATQTIRKPGQLTSCLKRHDSMNNGSASRRRIHRCGSSSFDEHREEEQDAEDLLKRPPSVTFDSQIEVLAFEPEVERSHDDLYEDLSWTDLFFSG